MGREGEPLPTRVWLLVDEHVRLVNWCVAGLGLALAGAAYRRLHLGTQFIAPAHIPHVYFGGSVRLTGRVVSHSGADIEILHVPIVKPRSFEKSQPLKARLFGISVEEGSLSDRLGPYLDSRYKISKTVNFQPVALGKVASNQEESEEMLLVQVFCRPSRLWPLARSVNRDVVRAGLCSVVDQRHLSDNPAGSLQSQTAILHQLLQHQAVAQAKSRGIWRQQRAASSLLSAVGQKLKSFVSRRSMSTDAGAITAESLKEKLQSALDASLVEVTDTSGGCGASFSSLIVSDKFQDLKLIQRHRLVNQTLAEELKLIHAFQMKTMTQQEYQKATSS